MTTVSGPLQWVTSLLFLATLVLVPSVELAAGNADWRSFLRRAVTSAADAFRNHGLLAANRSVLAEMHAFENALDEGSVVGEWALPRVQTWMTRWAGVGNEQALLGRERWLFYRPGIELLTGPGFLEEGVLEARRRAVESWMDPIEPDPRIGIRSLREELASRGIELVLLPVPVKATVEPARFSKRAEAVEPPVENPSWSRWLEWLRAEGVTVVDPVRIWEEAGTHGPPLYLAGDTHWTPESMEHVADGLAAALEDLGLLSGRRKDEWKLSSETVSHTGDLVEMLRLPADQDLFPEQQVTIHPVAGADGALWRPDREAEVLLLGDSYTNVYSTPDLGWGRAAGLAEQLAYRLERPVDRIAVNAGGALGSRERLARELADGSDRLGGKRVVVWELSTRELAFGDWREVSLSTPGGETRRASLPETHLEEGFVVWESNRTGDWRIFLRRFGEAEARQISPDEPGMQHCCPHVSPDGRRIAYLSRPVGKREYPTKEVPGPLRLISVDDGSERTIAPEARSYGWGDRAVVWRDDGQLIFIDGAGRTVLLDLGSGERTLLVPEKRESMSWLLDPTLRVATNAAPVFAPYDRASRTVLERDTLGGCEPYFTADGRWGFWVAGAGGPLNRIDLETREVRPIVRKNDPRLDPARRYLYFAMTSRDGRMLAWGASDGAHDHFEADYDIYVAPIDPETLELSGTPVRITQHPATDRYPDVYLAPLPLGRHRGEAPFDVQLRTPDDGAWRWFVNGTPAGRGPTFEHRFEQPGVYRVEAREGEEGTARAGQVVVDPSRPPEVLGAELRGGGSRIVVRFSEPVDMTSARVELDPADALESWEASEGGRSLEVRLARSLDAGGRLRLFDVTDRAQRPNRLEPTWIEVAAPSWPSSREELAFLWQTDDRENLVFDPTTGKERAYPLEAVGRAFLDHDYAMRADGGYWLAPEAGKRVVEEAERSGAVSLEVTLTPDEIPEGAVRAVVSIARGSRPDLLLGQRGPELILRILTSEQRNAPPISLARLEPGRAHHVVVSYSPARLRAWIDGDPVALEAQPRGHLNRWRDGVLSFGAMAGGDAAWRGKLEGVAIWARALDEEEAREDFLRYRRIRSARPEVRSRTVTARLVGISDVPTLGEISPYRVALATLAWEITAGPDRGETLKAAHWVILDGETQPAARMERGREALLTLEPFPANPQLEPHFLSDTVGEGGAELWYATGVEEPP